MNIKKSLVALCLLVAFASCKKSYNCSCETTYSITSQGLNVASSIETSKTLNESSEKKAQTACDEYKTQSENDAKQTLSGGQSGGTYSTTCSLTKI